MSAMDKMLDGMPMGMRNSVTNTLDNIGLMLSIKNPKVAMSMAPSAMRGMVMKKGKGSDAVKMHSGHAVHFDLNYGTDFPEMWELYRRAVANQWDGERDLDWSTDVDPMNPENCILPEEYAPFEGLAAKGVHFNAQEKQRFQADLAAWTLAQFMHGEQGALYAAAQVTESVQWLDGKFYGATQVMDEGRHLEVFYRYLDSKMNKVYQVNDNLFVILDDLLTDSRWDVKFLGMQIMVEGLALGAFSTMYNYTREPLLKNLLRYVIQDEARHVHYGVLALREQITEHLSPRERREREDWAFELALLMRNRFMSHEIYHEWFGGGARLSLRDWNEVVSEAPGMKAFRQVMFQRLIPNLEYIGLMSDRIKQHYEKAGLATFLGGRNATQLSGEDLIAENDALSAAGAEAHNNEAA